MTLSEHEKYVQEELKDINDGITSLSNAVDNIDIPKTDTSELRYLFEIKADTSNIVRSLENLNGKLANIEACLKIIARNSKK
jgi:protein subunit release factor A